MLLRNHNVGIGNITLIGIRKSYCTFCNVYWPIKLKYFKLDLNFELLAPIRTL